jgi:hypothetical protein
MKRIGLQEEPHMTTKPEGVEYKQDMHQAMWASSVYVVILTMVSSKKNQRTAINRVRSVLPFMVEMIRVVLLEAVITACTSYTVRGTCKFKLGRLSRVNGPTYRWFLGWAARKWCLIA